MQTALKVSDKHTVKTSLSPAARKHVTCKRACHPTSGKVRAYLTCKVRWRGVGGMRGSCASLQLQGMWRSEV